MNHTLKIFLKILHNRIYKKCERNVSENQFGFRAGMGTREALFRIQVLVQNCLDVKKDVFMCFIDYEKAFDRVRHGKLIEILRKTDVDEDIRCIENLYWYQRAHVKTQSFRTEDIRIRREVRQSCVLSPRLFNMYSEEIFSEAFEDSEQGIKVNGIPISNLIYADDSVLLANNMTELQDMCTRLNIASNRYGLNINANKTKFMIISRDKLRYANSTPSIGNQLIERVEKYQYLGCWLHADWNPEQKIRTRIEKGRAAFLKFKNVLNCRDIQLQLRLRYAKCYIWSVLLYGVKAWTMKTNTINKLEAFEMWTYRRLLKISWTDRITNEEVLNMMQKERELLNIIKKRKTSYLGHIVRNEKYNILQLILEGKIEGKRGIGRKQLSWARNIRQWTGLKTIGELINTARDRDRFQHVVANIQ